VVLVRLVGSSRVSASRLMRPISHDSLSLRRVLVVVDSGRSRRRFDFLFECSFGISFNAGFVRTFLICICTFLILSFLANVRAEMTLLSGIYQRYARSTVHGYIYRETTNMFFLERHGFPPQSARPLVEESGKRSNPRHLRF